MEVVALMAGFVVLVNLDQRRHAWIRPLLRVIGVLMTLGSFAVMHHVWNNHPLYEDSSDNTIKWVLLVVVGFMTFLFMLLAVWPQGLQKEEPRVSRHFPPQ